MLHLLAEAASSNYVSGGVVVTFVGLAVWLFKWVLPKLISQYREDIISQQDKYDSRITNLIDKFDASLDRLFQYGMEERKESRKTLSNELQKRDDTLEKISEVLKEVVENVRILSDEVRTLKQLIPVRAEL